MTPRLGLMARLLAAITLVLCVAFVVSFVIQSNLGREALREQSEDVLDNQVRQIGAAIERRTTELRQEATASRKDLATDVDITEPADRVAIIDLLDGIDRRREFTVISAYSRDGDAIVHKGPRLAPPPPGLFDNPREAWVPRVVPTTNGGLALVAGQLIGIAPRDTLVVLGYEYDDAFARRLRDSGGGNEVVLLAQNVGVATSLRGHDVSSMSPGPDADGLPVDTVEVAIGGEDYLARYRVVAAAGPFWGVEASVGALVIEPLADLDQRLLEVRLQAGVMLLLLGVVLAWLVSRQLTEPLRRLTATAEAIAEGDLDRSFRATSRDEVGVLARTLEQMRQALRRQVAHIRAQTRELQRSAGRIVGAQDEARRRLAGELHDGVQQQLVMLRLQLGMGKQRLRTQPGDADEVLDDLAEQVDTIIARLRDTSQGIYPAILRDLGLRAALSSIGGRTPMVSEVVVEPDPFPRLSHELEANAYFMVAEAVTNAVKHAEATSVSIRVSCDLRNLTLVIADDGVGFDESTITAGGGLRNLRDRARALDGQVAITSEVGVGTTVAATLPLRATPETDVETGDGSVAGALEEEQDSGDAPVEVDVLPEAQLLEDAVDVLLDGAVGDDEVAGDAAVALSRRHQGEDLEFSRRESGEA